MIGTDHPTNRIGRKAVIAARGVVEFTVTTGRYGETALIVTGENTWRRPVVAMVGFDESVPAHWSAGPIIADETGATVTPHQYIERLRPRSGDYDPWYSTLWTHRYLPHVDGPIGDAPQIRAATAAERYATL